MQPTVIFVKSEQFSSSVTTNWNKVLDQVDAKFDVAYNITEMFNLFYSAQTVLAVCIDWALFNQEYPQEDLHNIVTSLRTLAHHNNKKSLAVCVGVDSSIDVVQLRQLVEIKYLSILVKSDLKKLEQCRNWVAACLVGQAYHSASVAPLLASQPAIYERGESRKTHVTFVGTGNHRVSVEAAVTSLCNQTRMRANTFFKLSTLIKCLASQNFGTDIIIIDSECFDHFNQQSVSDMVVCLITAYHTCHSNKIDVYVSAGQSVNHNILRQVIKLPHITGVIPSAFDGFSASDFSSAVLSIPQGQKYVHPMIESMLQPKRLAQKPKEILSSRQKEILQLVISQGASNKVIANRLKISEGAVKTHIGKLLRRFGVRSRTELAALNHHF